MQRVTCGQCKQVLLFPQTPEEVLEWRETHDCRKEDASDEPQGR